MTATDLLARLDGLKREHVPNGCCTGGHIGACQCACGADEHKTRVEQFHAALTIALHDLEALQPFARTAMEAAKALDDGGIIAATVFILCRMRNAYIALSTNIRERYTPPRDDWHYT